MCGDGGGWLVSPTGLPAHHILRTVTGIYLWRTKFCFELNSLLFAMFWHKCLKYSNFGGLIFSLDFHIFLNRLNNIRAYPFLSLMSWSDSAFIAQICFLFAVLALVSEQFPRKSGKLQQVDNSKKKAKINRELKLETQPYMWPECH